MVADIGAFSRTWNSPTYRRVQVAPLQALRASKMQALGARSYGGQRIEAGPGANAEFKLVGVACVAEVGEREPN